MIDYSTLSGPIAIMQLKANGSLYNNFFANVYTGTEKAINYDAATGNCSSPGMIYAPITLRICCSTIVTEDILRHIRPEF